MSPLAPLATRKNSNFLTYDPDEFVQQCCLAMHFLFGKIPRAEFFSPKYDDPDICPNLLNLKQLKERVSRCLSSFLLLSAAIFFHQ